MNNSEPRIIKQEINEHSTENANTQKAIFQRQTHDWVENNNPKPSYCVTTVSTPSLRRRKPSLTLHRYDHFCYNFYSLHIHKQVSPTRNHPCHRVPLRSDFCEIHTLYSRCPSQQHCSVTFHDSDFASRLVSLYCTCTLPPGCHAIHRTT
ncbi:hypothetical protein T07_7997 [Trichinella nelsoni]|uniref:Uncharacterized protein n=1 Tax=Trichinella nelsoni TaxID=6336 RepID=A0A0V0RLB9_9BILA|nr:hypothetical protein T07_7997 [Trichinella nelsoni]